MILLNSGRNGGQTRPFAAGGRKGNELRRPHERLVNLMHSNAICKSAPYGHPRNRPARLCPLPALGMPQPPKLKVAGQMPPSCPEPAMPSGRASPCRPMQVGPHRPLPGAAVHGRSLQGSAIHTKLSQQQISMVTHCLASRLRLLWPDDQHASRTPRYRARPLRHCQS